jgi:hypothetical protein
MGKSYFLKTILMKKLLFTLVSVIGMITTSLSQSPYKFDYVETYDNDWSGMWYIPAATTGYYTNAFVSSTSSAVIYGTGTGSSAYESDWYSFPNLVVDPAYEYQFKFRLASYRFTSSAGTKGVDGGDYIMVQLSTDGGVSYVNELRVKGMSNAYWNYNTAASYTKTADGTLTIIGPAAGGDRTATGDGYSVIQLNIPAGTSQIAIDIFARVNGAGEEWWMDNFELTRIDNTPLPVELTQFEATPYPQWNVVKWTTASENNSSHFDLESSTDGENWRKIITKYAAGNSTEEIKYSYIDYNLNPVTYYRLQQFDIDGVFKTYGPILVTKTITEKKIVKYINLMGQEVNPDYTKGLVIEIYDDGSIRKMIR